ncbi:MAG TPA: S41 family peptidase [Cyclobacteriaceae bacterium]|nr:S41 family peptidase [Cyclobacteriaceae bacterium]
MKHYLLLMVLLLSGTLSMAQTQPQWARYPSLSPDGKTIVFTYKGDLYSVPSSGGKAEQLTFHEAHDFMPVWSRDSKKIAFASDRYGNFDVFVMDAEGGEATRLTYHSNDEFPYTFSADNAAVLFGGVRQDLVSHRQYPTSYQPELYRVPATGGRVDMVMTVPAEYVQLSKDGSKLVYHDKKGGENEWRKHHTSSVARDLWLYDVAKDSHQKLTSFYGENRNPVFANNDQDLFYLSEASGSFNVHKLSLDKPEQNQQITKFDRHPVRFLSASEAGLLCFSYDGELYTLKEGEAPKKVDITLRTQTIKNKDQYISINGGVREMSISPDGKEVAFISRGEVFVASVDGSTTKRITTSPEQEQFLSFAPDGKSLIYAAERNGKWVILQSKKVRDDEPFFFASTLIEETALLDNEHDNYLPKLSPDGKKLAYVEDRRTLKVMDMASKETVTLLTPKELFHMRDGDQYFNWSPDSQWLLASYRPTMVNSEVVLLAADGKRGMINLTQSGYGDYNPQWVNGGKQMLWFSNRDGLKGMAASGSTQYDVYTLFFTQKDWDKFNLNKDDHALLEEIEKKAKDAKKDEKEDKDKKDDKKVEKVEIDWEGLRDRKAKLTIHSSDLGDAVLSKDGEKLYYLARFEKNMNLWSTNLRTKETKMELSLNAERGSLEWDKEMKNLFLLSGGKVTKINPEGWKQESVKINGEMIYDVDAERDYMFEHVWLRTQAIFYTPDMHGVDWKAVKGEYAKYLPHIGNSYEFAEMLSEMIGELNVSHAGARYSRSIPEADATASLGVFIDYAHQGKGVKIAEIVKGGPLDKADLDIKAGMIIEKIDGQEISADEDWAKFLNRKAGQFTAIELTDAKGGNKKQLTVKPISLSEEAGLLYKRWVRKNQEEVDSLSKGELGYVHIPGMSDGPFRDIYEEMMGKYHDRKGVIVDTRFNGGGDLVADLAMFFTGERFLTYATEDREVGYEPTFRWTKPTLAMFNEANYSDGHCFACGYTDLNIGTTVGMPVPGTCSFAGWEMLPDGTRWGAVPVSVKNKAGEWLENNETRPDIEVKNMPGIIDKGRDQQLERAIEELLKQVK